MSRSLLVKEMEKFNFPKKYFVETGTYTGGGVQVALYMGFENIYSVEIDKAMQEANKKKFPENVKLYTGKSSTVLKRILPKLDSTAVIFLDAHAPDYNPIFDELEVIKEQEFKEHIILIDDIKQYDGTYWDIPVRDLMVFIKEINPNYTIERMNSVNGKGDILVAWIPPTQ